MKEHCENANELISQDKKVKIKIGSKIQILEQTGWTSEELTYPYEGIVTELTEEWDSGTRATWDEDWGHNMIQLNNKYTFYPNDNFTNIKVLEY